MTPLEMVLAALSQSGLLIKQDKTIPSVVGILTGESLHTSWWSHPKAHLIFSVVSELADHPDVLLTKLLHRKETFVHRSMWPALLSVGLSREPWQMQGLSPSAVDLLKRIDGSGGPLLETGAAVKDLEGRILVVGQEIHTESGRHVMAIESWSAWAAKVGCETIHSIPQAKELLEQATLKLGAPLKALPWPALSAAT